MAKPVSIGFIGYGRSARIFHLPFIAKNPNFKVSAFYQRSAPPADAGSAEAGSHCTVDYPDAKHYQDLDKFLADPEIELVSIVTRHDTHASFAEKALLAGKHVVVEKPFALSTEEANKAIAASKKSGKILTVFQSRRYDSDMQTLIKLHESKCLGEITEAEIHYDIDLPPWMKFMSDPGWKPGDGMNFGIGCHSLDQALYFFGRPKSITAFYRVLRGVKSETEDTFTMILQYEDSPLIVNVKTHVCTTMRYPLKYFIRGNDGTFIKFGDDRQEDQLTAQGMKPEDPGFGVEPEDMWGELTTRKQFSDAQEKKGELWIGKIKSEVSSISNYYNDVARAIHGEIELVVKPEMSRDGIRLIELARESAEKGVTLPFDM